MPATTRSGVEPEQAAMIAVARRAKPSAVPGHVKVVLTLDVRRVLAEQLSAKAIRQGERFEVVVIEILESRSR